MMKRSFKWLVSVFCIMAVLVFGVATSFASEAANWESGTITVEGYGAPPANARSIGQANILARRAAIVDAYRNLAEEVYGVQVDSETTVQDAMVANDIINTNVRAVIKGARLISGEQQADGSYKVTMQLRMFGQTGSLASAVLPQNTTPEPFPLPAALPPAPLPSASDTTSAAPVPVEAAGMRAVGSYTGLVIDCSGMGLNPMMSPVIKNASDQPIYGYKNLDSAKVIAHGMAGYAHDMDGTSRAGSHPLVIKAVALENHNGYPVISVEDANRVLVENAASHFLDCCAVVFIR